MKCPECKGSKVYVGLSVTEPCARCKGTGEVDCPVKNVFVASPSRDLHDVVLRKEVVFDPPIEFRAGMTAAELIAANERIKEAFKANDHLLIPHPTGCSCADCKTQAAELPYVALKDIKPNYQQLNVRSRPQQPLSGTFTLETVEDCPHCDRGVVRELSDSLRMRIDEVPCPMCDKGRIKVKHGPFPNTQAKQVFSYLAFRRFFMPVQEIGKQIADAACNGIGKAERAGVVFNAEGTKSGRWPAGERTGSGGKDDPK